MRTEFKNFRKNKKSFSFMTVLFFWVLFLPATVFAFVRAMLPVQTINLFGVDFYIVSNTKSMEPFFKYNDLIAVKKYNFERIEVGDIVSFAAIIEVEGKKRQVVITHKVIETVKDADGITRSLKTQGINTETREDKIQVTVDGAHGTNTYLGKYFYKSAVLGRVIAFFSSPYGLVIIFIDCVCIALIGMLKKDEDKSLLEGI